jgi:hypothetical protein
VIRPGDFGVARTRGVIGWLIRWVTASPVNHAFVCVAEGQIVEARWRGAQAGHVRDYPQAIWSDDAVPVTDAQRAAIAMAARSLTGRGYNFLDLVAIGLAQRRLGHEVTGREWWVQRLSTDNRLICSQLVDQAYLLAGVHLFADGRLPGLVSPGDLYALIMRQAVTA